MLRYEFDERARASLLEGRIASVVQLREALARLETEPGWAALQELAEVLPTAISVDVAAVGLCDPEDGGHLYLVASSGLTGRELARLTFRPLNLKQARAVLASLPHNTLSRELGLVWGSGRWLRSGSSVGALLVGCRTRRLPSPAELALLDLAADELATTLEHVAPERRRIGRRAAALARQLGVGESRPSKSAPLRPRETLILELYADGLGTMEIAELLVVSPHTVRTHVRNALRRLGVRSRGEAIRRLHDQQVLTLLDVARTSPARGSAGAGLGDPAGL